MTCQRDEFVRGLLLANFDYVEDLKSAQLFRRPGDGAEVLVPKRASIEQPAAVIHEEPRQTGKHSSPCCHIESPFLGTLHGKTILRCPRCLAYWGRHVTTPALRLVP